MKQSALALAILFLLCAPISCGSETDIVRKDEPKSASAVSYETTFVNTDISTYTTAKAQTSVKADTVTTVKAADVNDTVYTAVPVADTSAQNVPVQTQPANTAPTTVSGFRKGTVSGLVYTSEYAGFRFNGMDTIRYMSDDDIYTETHMAGRFMSQEDRDKIDTIIVDACGVYDDCNSRVTFSFVDTKARFPEKTNVTLEDIVPHKAFDGAEWVEFNVTDPVSVSLGSRAYQKIRVSNSYSDRVVYHYISKIDDEYTLDISFSANSQDDGSEFESRFEALV